ncbi:MAG: otsA [Bryobacterales bacterium]|nr:otsA [Bryobacterales bacterium]
MPATALLAVSSSSKVAGTLRSAGSSVWTKDELIALVREQLLGHKLILVSNREPYVHRWVDGRIEVQQPASGMAAALDPILRVCGGVWIAHGAGDADRETVNERNEVCVPPFDPKYTLRRVWLTEQQEHDYYYGCSNQIIWPLCHVVFTRPLFEQRYWDAYREVNQLFADAVLDEAADQPALVFIQDYHFALLPRMLKERNPNLIVAQFWHIPWPTAEIFRVFPWGEEMLDGMLGNDLMGFHLRYHSRNFADSVRMGIEARADQTGFDLTRNGHTTLVRAFPISIDFEEFSALGDSAEVAAERENWVRELKLEGKLVGAGIDRIDYTKGIPERLRAFNRLLERSPEYRERLVFVQIGVPSRGEIPDYHALDDEITNLVREINKRWGTRTWKPVALCKGQYNAAEMVALHRLANFFVVSSLHDGMNLVAKEFAASRTDGDGVLVLSRFAGAAREMSQALLVNPFAVEELATAYRTALEMPEEERRRRMRKLRTTLKQNNIYRWASELLSALLRLE